jgi:hypothetical protein
MTLLPAQALRGSCGTGARNGNLEVPVYFLKAKQGYIVRKMSEDGWV